MRWRRWMRLYKPEGRGFDSRLCHWNFDIYKSKRLLLRVTLEISRASCYIDVTPGTLTATDTCIGYHVTRFEASRKVILHTRYVSTCVGAGCGRGRETNIQTKAIRCRACYYSIMLNAHRVTNERMQKATNDTD
jgi:hypothetical protein